MLHTAVAFRSGQHWILVVTGVTISRQTDATYVSLGLLTNRGLAYEGLYMWKDALRDYDEVC